MSFSGRSAKQLDMALPNQQNLMKKRRKKPLVLRTGVGNACLSSCNKGIGIGEVLDLKTWQSLAINIISLWQGAGISKHS